MIKSDLEGLSKEERFELRSNRKGVVGVYQAIHASREHLLSTYYVPSTVQSTCNTQ